MGTRRVYSRKSRQAQKTDSQNLEIYIDMMKLYATTHKAPYFLDNYFKTLRYLASIKK